MYISLLLNTYMCVDKQVQPKGVIRSFKKTCKSSENTYKITVLVAISVGKLRIAGPSHVTTGNFFEYFNSQTQPKGQADTPLTVANKSSGPRAASILKRFAIPFKIGSLVALQEF